MTIPELLALRQQFFPDRYAAFIHEQPPGDTIAEYNTVALIDDDKSYDRSDDGYSGVRGLA